MRATFAWSASETSTLCASLRLVFVSFDVRMWRIFDWPRLNLPVPVFLKRLAAPRCVFILGMVILLEKCCPLNRIQFTGGRECVQYAKARYAEMRISCITRYSAPVRS